MPILHSTSNGLTTRWPHAVVLSAMGGGWEAWEDDVKKGDSGWDERHTTMAKDFGATGTDGQAIANAFRIGAPAPGGGNFWITGVGGSRNVGGGIWTTIVSSKGLSAARPIKVRGKTSVQQSQGSSIWIFESGYPNFVNKLEALESSPTVEIERISFTQPQTGEVGRAGVPAYAVAVRASVWGSLTDPLWHFPSGWVMVDIDWDKLTGVNVWLIKETWAWIPKITP